MVHGDSSGEFVVDDAREHSTEAACSDLAEERALVQLIKLYNKWRMEVSASAQR